MRLKVKEIAERVGIRNAAQLRARTGLGMRTVYQLWNEETTLVSLQTLNTLCNALQVGPAMLLEYTPDVEPRASEPTPAAGKRESRRTSPVRGKGATRKARATAKGAKLGRANVRAM